MSWFLPTFTMQSMIVRAHLFACLHYYLINTISTYFHLVVSLSILLSQQGICFSQYVCSTTNLYGTIYNFAILHMHKTNHHYKSLAYSQLQFSAAIFKCNFHLNQYILIGYFSFPHFNVIILVSCLCDIVNNHPSQIFYIAFRRVLLFGF